MPPKPSGLYHTHYNIPRPNTLENWSHLYYEEEIIKVQKESLWKKLHSVSRENKDINEKIHFQEQQNNNFKDKLKILTCLILTFQDNLFPLMQSFGFNFNKISTDLFLSNLYTNDFSSDDLNHTLADFENQFLSFAKFLESNFMPLKSQLHSLITKFTQDEASLQQSEIKNFLSCQTWLLPLTNSTSQSNNGDSDSVHKNNNLEEQNRLLKADLEFQKASYQQKLEEIDQLKSRLQSAEKQVDFLMLHPPKESEDTKSEKEPEPQVIPDVTPDTDKIKQRFEKQIETLIKEKSQLKVDFDRLKLQIFEVPTKKIEESYLFNQAQHNNARLKSENESLLSKVQELSNEISQFHGDKNKLIVETQEQIVKRNEFLENSMSKTLHDLTRVRKHRDNLMTELQIYKTKEETQSDHKQALLTLTESQTIQITRLKSENHRLQTKVAYLSGNEDAITFLENNKDLSTTEEYQDKLIAYEKHLQTIVEKCSCGVANIPEDLLATSKYHIENGHSFNSNKNVSNNENNENESETIVRQKNKIHDLERQLEIQKTAQAQLAKEVENVFQSWTILQNQASSKILNLGEKEDRILELMSEQTKLEQKLNSSNKERNQLNTLIQSLKRQNDKQTEYILKLEERVNNQSVQLAISERQVNAYKDGLIEIENKSKTYAQENFLFIDRMKVFESQMKQMDQNLVERTKELEEIRYDRQELREQLKQATKRIDALSSSGNTELVDELNEKIDNLKTILKCPACNLNFKTHVINRCMHVFCEDCIQSRITTRQRKCPQCNEPFGVQDMKQLYL